MRINPSVHEHRSSAIQDIARKAGAARKTIFEELRRNEGAESALQDAVNAIEACKGEVKRELDDDHDVDSAKDKMTCFDRAMAAVANLKGVAHVNIILLTGKLAQADEHINHCEALFNDEQRILGAYMAAREQEEKDAIANRTEDYDSERDDQAENDGHAITPKAPPRPIEQLMQHPAAAHGEKDVPVGKPVPEDEHVYIPDPEPKLARVSPPTDDDIEKMFKDDGEDATGEDGA